MARAHEELERNESEAPRLGGFRHEALLYAGPDEFVNRVGSFAREALERDEPILVAVSAQKIDLLRQELGRDATRVRFADMEEIGRNPGRIISAWIDFLNETGAHEDRLVRGIGEPISHARSPEELVEAERHEALLNVAIGEDHPLWLACPYDVESLGPEVLERARRNHPVISDGQTSVQSQTYPGRHAFAKPFDAPLPEPAAEVKLVAVTIDTLDRMRREVTKEAMDFGLPSARIADLVLCVNEVATNSILHGGGEGCLRMWRSSSSIVCEVSDSGRIEDPLAGRSRPDLGHANGYGLWLSNQLCDLVQMRVLPAGTVVRLTMRRR